MSYAKHCPDCEGTGYEMLDDERVYCPTCNGRGWVTADACPCTRGMLCTGECRAPASAPPLCELAELLLPMAREWTRLGQSESDDASLATLLAKVHMMGRRCGEEFPPERRSASVSAGMRDAAQMLLDELSDAPDDGNETVADAADALRMALHPALAALDALPARVSSNASPACSQFTRVDQEKP